MTIRKNVASQKLVFSLVNATTGAALTGATVTAKLSIDGGSSATASGSVAELANGQYCWSPAQADTNGNALGVQFTATNAVPSAFTIYTTAADPTDAVRLGLTALPNAAAEAAGGLFTRGTGAGQINQPANGMVDANVVRNAGTAITAAAGVQEVKVASLAANAITAAAIAADAITAAKIADGAIDAATFAAGAIDATAIATDAIGSAEIAASAVTKIQSGLSTYAGADTAGTTTLLSRLSATRAGYLDNLSAGAVALEASLQGLITTVGASAAGIATAVWGAATRILTAATNITSTGGTTVPQTGDAFARAGAPAGASLAADIAAVKTVDDAIKAKTDHLPSSDIVHTTGKLWVLDGSGNAVAPASATTAIQAKTDNLPSDPADESLIITATDALLAAINALNNVSTTQIRTQVDAALDSTVPDSIPADGSRPSMRQAAYLGTQFLLERGVSGTTMTIYKPDGTTALATLTLNDATAPTALTRAS